MHRAWDFAALQAIGQREQQEDYCAFLEANDAVLAVLADGMGGHEAGEIAARLSVDTFIKAIQAMDGPWAGSFLSAVHAANTALSSHVDQHPERAGMGCTLIGADIAPDCIRWVSVGDSRLYLFSNDTLEQLNADHSMGSRLDGLAARGEITFEQAQTDESRHMLLSALTGEQIELLDYSRKARVLSSGDLIILASDGLDSLTREDVQERLSKYKNWKASDIARGLLSAVLKCGKPRQDNISIIVVKHGSTT
ncbi:PP2C family protein-serine/threonine phosphatase [Roseibium sp.]|uniref:PP2C family protein-serine/threonine phosphatase n=1 Tax=Roseibium sp. TaxID=1936156 RepID=UPI003A9796C8